MGANSKIPVTISSFANRRITRQLIPATRNASKRIHCPSRTCPLTFPRRLSPSIDRSRARKDLYRTRLGISPTYNRLNDLDFISPLEPARRTIDLSSARSPPPQKDVAGILFHTHTHTTSCSRLVRAKGQERAAESSMPRRFFPLSNAPLPTRSPYGVNDNHDSPPRATRRPLSFDAITRRSPDHRGYQRLDFSHSLSLSRRVTIRITWRESTKLEEEENEIYDLDLRNRRDRRSFIYFCSVSFYRELLEWINGKGRRGFSIRELFKEERKK